MYKQQRAATVGHDDDQQVYAAVTLSGLPWKHPLRLFDIRQHWLLISINALIFTTL